MPSKGVLIRLCIYLPIIGFLAWRAFAPREPEPQPESVDTEGLPTRSFTTEDGKKIDVIQVTPEQAEQLMGRPLPTPEQAEGEAKGEAKPDAPPAADAPSE
jgi:hypothetical protein